MNDLSNDPRFTELPQWIQDGLRPIPVTGMMDEDEWHEVGFHMDKMICQCAIVNRRWVALPQQQIDSFDSLVYVLDEGGGKQMINLAIIEAIGQTILEMIGIGILIGIAICLGLGGIGFLIYWLCAGG